VRWLNLAVVVAALSATFSATALAQAIPTEPALAPEPPTAGAPEAPEAEVDAPAPSKLRASKRPATPPGPFAVPDDLPQQARFVVVELHEEVSLGMAAYVERVANRLERDDILVLDINTFGGRVDAAVMIRDALLHAGDRGAKVVAYVNPRAISAGALISFAADVIVVAPGSTMGAATPVQIEGGKMESVEEKVVSYMREEMRSTAEARGRNGDIASAMVDPDVEIDGLDDAGKTLTLDGKASLAWGIASFEAHDFDALVAGLGYGGPGGKPYTVVEVGWSWAETVAGWLSGSVLSGLLMTIGMLGIMIGLYTGGPPLALGLGAGCLALFFFGHHIVNLAGIEDILLFLVGLSLIAFEVLVPGHILPGVAGLLCVVAALFLGLVDFGTVDFSVQWEAGYIGRALSTVFGSLLATVILGYAAFKLLPDTPFGRGLVLSTAIDVRASDDVQRQAAGIVGEIGETATGLRPSGKVVVRGKRYDAQAESGYIDAGVAVRVVRSDGFHIVVTPVEPKEETS
jgi:membrane-bound serine protease (ClpP class)